MPKTPAEGKKLHGDASLWLDMKEKDRAEFEEEKEGIAEEKRWEMAEDIRCQRSLRRRC